MSRGGGLQRLGIDLDALRDDGTPPAFSHPECPGALLRLTHDDEQALTRLGVRFAEEGTRVPPKDKGYGPARVFCGAPVESWKGAAGHVVYGGRCYSCGQLEKDNRQLLRARQGGEEK